MIIPLARMVHLVRRASHHLHRDERGQALPLMIGSIMLFLALGVTVVDFGLMFGERRAAQRAVDLAALAAAQDLPGRANDPNAAAKLASAETTADEFLIANGFDPLAGATVAVTTTYAGDPGKIEVRAGRTFTWLFGGLFGVSTQQINARAVASANSQPRDIVLVLDRSGSMCQATHGGPMLTCPNPPGDPDRNGLADWQPFDTMRSASLDFGTVLVPTANGQPLDRLSLVSYSTTGELRLALSNNYGANSPYSTAIAGMRPDGYTNIGYGIALARAQLAANGRADASKVIVLLSDGFANRYRTGGTNANPTFTTCANTVTCAAADNYARTEATSAAAAGASIYTIGYTGGAGAGLLRDVATIGATTGGGGAFFSVEDPQLLRDTFFEIASLTRIALIE